MKVCSKCNMEKSENDFYKGNAKCKSCKIDYQKKHSKLNKDRIKEYKRKYRIENMDEIKTTLANYYKENCEKIKEISRKNYSNNRDKKIKYQTDYQRNRRISDPIYKLKFSISRMIRNSLKINNFIKTKRTKEILGCSIVEFKNYIENKFTDKMGWENYGVIWDIDHIVPLSTAITEEDVIKLNHYSNLQPLDSYINRYIKRDKLDFYL